MAPEGLDGQGERVDRDAVGAPCLAADLAKARTAALLSDEDAAWTPR
jgi:hypothetical protein